MNLLRIYVYFYLSFICLIIYLDLNSKSITIKMCINYFDNKCKTKPFNKLDKVVFLPTYDMYYFR